MKKFLSIAVMAGALIGYVFAESKIGDIGPGFSDRANVIIGKPGPNKRNCITDVVFSSTGSAGITGVTTFRMLSDNTTTFMVVMSTANPPVIDPFTDAWCADYGSSATIKSDGATYQIYYKGYIGYNQ